MEHLHIIDIGVIILYFVFVTAIGLWSARKVHNMDDFVMPRRFGKAMMVMFSFGAGTSSDQAVSVASKSFTNGLSGIWYQWLYLFCSPFYWLIAPVMRRFRALTTADVFEARYNRSLSVLFAIVGLGQYLVTIGLMLKTSSVVIDACTSGMVNADLAIILMTVIFVIYGLAGGLGAAIITDFFQGILTIIFSFLLLPYVLKAVGGLDAMREYIPTVVADTDMFSLVAPGEIGVFYIIIIAFNALVGIVTQPHIMGNCAAGRTELDGQVGFMGGNLVKRICTIAWSLTGLAGVAYFAQKGIEPHPDKVFGLLAKDFLPAISPGLMGLFLSALLASVMSSCDAFMASSAGLFAENIYKPVVTDKSQKHYLWVARFASLAVVAGGVFFAYWLEGVIQGLEIFWKISPMMGIAFWLGLFWRRTTVAGAWAATLSAIFVWWLSSQEFFINSIANLSFAESLRLVYISSDGPEIYLPWQMVLYLSVGTVVGILVSLFTPRVNEKKLDNFYALIRTPVTLGEHVEEPCTLPEGTVTPLRRNVFPNSKDLEIPVPTLRGLSGFFVGWLFVAAIIGVVYWIAGG